MSKSMDDFYQMEANILKKKQIKFKKNIEFYGLILLNIGLFSVLLYLFKTTSFFL